MDTPYGIHYFGRQFMGIDFERMERHYEKDFNDDYIRYFSDRIVRFDCRIRKLFARIKYSESKHI